MPLLGIAYNRDNAMFYHIPQPIVAKSKYTANKTRGFAVDLLCFHGKSTSAFVEKPISTDGLSRSKLGSGNRQIHESAPIPRHFHDFCFHDISTTTFSTANPRHSHDKSTSRRSPESINISTANPRWTEAGSILQQRCDPNCALV